MIITKQEYLDIYDVVGAAMEVHQTLGRGLAEPLYQEALDMEMASRDMAAEREKLLICYYKGKEMKKHYVADLYYKGIIVELKSVEKLCSEHRAQLINYMRISHHKKGLLINFGERSLRVERYIYNVTNDDFILLTKQNYKDYIIEE
jgi:GxxExxY protein